VPSLPSVPRANLPPGPCLSVTNSRLANSIKPGHPIVLLEFSLFLLLISAQSIMEKSVGSNKFLKILFAKPSIEQRISILDDWSKGNSVNFLKMNSRTECQKLHRHITELERDKDQRDIQYKRMDIPSFPFVQCLASIKMDRLQFCSVLIINPQQWRQVLGSS
jgi:hypothetical protein